MEVSWHYTTLTRPLHLVVSFPKHLFRPRMKEQPWRPWLDLEKLGWLVTRFWRFRVNLSYISHRRPLPLSPSQWQGLVSKFHYQTLEIMLILCPSLVTVEQGASTAYATAPPIIVTNQSIGQVSYQGFKSNCSFDISKNTGACVEEDEFPSLQQTGLTTEIATSTTTYSGALIPFATTSDANSNSIIVLARALLFVYAIISLMIILW